MSGRFLIYKGFYFSNKYCIFESLRLSLKTIMNKHQDIHIHPGEILLEDVIKPAGVTIGEAAGMLKVSRLTLSKILNGRGGITPNIALRIEADFWLRLQRTYDLEEERRNLLLHPVHLEKFRYV